MSWAPPGLKRKPRTVAEAFGPPVTDVELKSNLSVLEQKLNREMVCHAGKNQVYLRSLLTGRSTTRPRVALKCHLRRDIGQTPEVFFEHIRDICCSDPEKCKAYMSFKGRHVVT